MERKAGIYRITVRRVGASPRYYIGQAVDMRERYYGHVGALRAGTCKNPAMQRAFTKYGEAAFSFEALQVCNLAVTSLTDAEQFWLDRQIAETGANSIYNVLLYCGQSRRGVPMSPETKAKLSSALKGRKQTPEQVEKNRKAHLGQKLSAESITKRSAKQRGRVVSIETRAKHAAALLGTVRSQETRQKISVSKKGWEPPPHHLEHLRTVNKGRPMPPHVREKLLTALTGRKKSPDEIARRQATRAANKAAKLCQR